MEPIIDDRAKKTLNEHKATADYEGIAGWGIDENKRNNPTYPIKHYTGVDHERLKYPKPVQQQESVEVLHSNERPGVTSVYGTSTPPRGLSGMLRRYAFKFSEGSSGHWLTLMLADRVNVVEGIVDDVLRGHVPNIFAERGWNAAWKYNRKATIKKIAVAAGVTSVLLMAFMVRSKKKGHTN
jgi:hypothetical protein